MAAMRDEPINQDRSPDRPQVNPNLNKAQPMEIMANEFTGLGSTINNGTHRGL